MKEIPLTQGKVALVDDADYEFLNQWKWCAHLNNRTWYAFRRRRASDPPGPATITMHGALLHPRKGLEVDHVDGDGLDNQRHKMRIVTRGINQANHIHPQRSRRLPMGAYSMMRGSRFYSVIHVDNISQYLGSFDTAAEAHAAYMAAREARIARAMAEVMP